MQEIQVAKNDISYHRMTRTEVRKMTFYEYFAWWVEQYKRDHIRQITYKKYRTTAKQIFVLAPRLMLTDLEKNRANLQWLLDQYGISHQKGTLRDFKNQLYSALRAAVEDDYLDKVATSQIVLNSIEQKWTLDQRRAHRDRPKSMSASEYRMFKTRIDIVLIDALKNPPEVSSEGSMKIHPDNHRICNQSKLMFLSIMLHTGCRFAEGMGVTFKDVHDATMTIDKTWDYKYNDDGKFQRTKNDASVRTIAIDETLEAQVAAFKKWKQKYFPGTDALPIVVEPHTIYFNSSMNGLFRRLQREYGIDKDLSVHKIRHTYISYLLNEGVSPESIAKQVGHADTNMIRKVYGHLLAERAEIDKMRIASLMR